MTPHGVSRYSKVMAVLMLTTFPVRLRCVGKHNVHVRLICLITPTVSLYILTSTPLSATYRYCTVQYSKRPNVAVPRCLNYCEFPKLRCSSRHLLWENFDTFRYLRTVRRRLIVVYTSGSHSLSY